MKNKPTRRISAGAVMLNNMGQVLVVSQHGTSWSLPKGGVEEGETFEQCLNREIFEETGIRQFEIIKPLGSYERFRGDIDGSYDKSIRKEIHMFLCQTDEIEIEPIDRDNPEGRWVEKERVVELLTFMEDKDFFQSIVNQIL